MAIQLPISNRDDTRLEPTVGRGRICLVLTSLCAEGTPVLALDLARLWKKHGFDPYVVTLYPEPADMLREFQEESLEVRCLNIRARSYAKFGKLALGMFTACREINPDVLVCFPFGWHSYMAYGARAAGVRRIVAHAGNYPPTHSQTACRKMAATVKLGFLAKPHIICCSDYVREGVRRHLGVPSRYLHTVYNGIQFATFAERDPNREFRLAARSLRCGMVARLENHKDQPTLVRAARLLRDRGVPLELYLVGEGSRREEYEELIAANGLTSVVHLMGMRRDVAALLASWDLFIFGAKTDEGLGIALIEALAARVPIIASDVGACREVLCRPGEEPLGELVSPESPEAIANAVERFTDNREMWRARAVRAEESARRRFSIEAMSEGYLQVMGLA